MKAINNIDKFATLGLFVTAFFSPCCFPLFAFVASALGLGSFELFGGWTMWIFQAMVIISLVGFFINYLKHRSPYPLLIALPSALLVFLGYYVIESENWTLFLYAGMFGLLIATIVNYYRNKLVKESISRTIKTMELKSTITCPNCGHKKEEIMPTDACQFFYDCENCKQVLKPKPGDCCVFCSYGNVPCPPIQNNKSCCS